MDRKEFIRKGVATGALMGSAAGLSPLAGRRPQEGEAAGSGPNVLWEELNSPRIGRLAAEDAMVLIPVGAIEQHGPHLPVMTDTLAAAEVSRRTALLLTEEGHPAVVAPAVWSGLSPHHMMFPGTITLDYDLFASLIKQICRCIHQHGFRRIVLINGHGGNVDPLRVLVREINEMLGRPAFVATYWNAVGSAMREILDTDTGIGHSGEAETSILLALRPDLVERPFDRSKGPDRPDPEELREGVAFTFRTYRDRTTIGVIGDAETATAEKGEKILSVAAGQLAQFLARDSLWEITW